MRTDFSPDQLADPAVASSEAAIRKCVHCGFCTATCPTYVLLGDELDSPRGRIYMIKDMLERERRPSPTVVKHVDRCLSCLSCVTTCPSGVNYMHLIDHARAYIHQHYARPLHERVLRRALAWVLPHPGRFRLALRAAAIGRPLQVLLEKTGALKPLAAMLKLAPRQVASRAAAKSSSVAGARGRVALLKGCAEPVLRPGFRAAAVRLINRARFDVVFAEDEGCCGALVHHLGREADGLAAARRNVDAWSHEIETKGLSAIVTTASGCGAMIKNYGFLLQNEPVYADKAKRVSALAKDITELLSDADLPPGNGRGLAVAYQSACSLQHGQRLTAAPVRMLAAAGYDVRLPAEAHLCCGSAGTYNILQPDIAGQLGDRKAARLEELQPDVVATGNIGCAMQIGSRVDLPVVHTVELLDWATGGPKPDGVHDHLQKRSSL